MTTSDSVLTGPRPTSVPSVGPVVAELEDEIVSFRRDLHRHPELSYEEYRTTDRIVELLSGYGLSPVRMESTGAYVEPSARRSAGRARRARSRRSGTGRRPCPR